MRFFKYQGLGNDFVIVTEPGALVSSEEARALCDRHFGVGADGVLLLAPDPSGDTRMTIQNADGSQAEMCGNGLRCAAAHLHRELGRRAASIRVGGFVAECLWQDGEVYRVELPAPKILGPRMVTVGERAFSGTFGTLGNPHFVVFDTDDPSRLVASYGGALSAQEDANVSFVRPERDSLRAVVFERGAGLTLACGSAACVIAAVAQRDRAPSAAPVAVDLPGGRLTIHLQEDRVSMTGAARYVFSGDWSC